MPKPTETLRDKFAMAALSDSIMCSECFARSPGVTIARDIVPSEVCKWPQHKVAMREKSKQD